ncbi:MAG: histone deacetylase, partial [Myxococcales bacterium]
PAHYASLAGTAGTSYPVRLDPDTSATAHSFEAACAAVGGGIALIDAVLDGRVDNGFALPRPPGHHALPHRSMGFCLFNNIAIAAEHLVRRRGQKRVAVVDFDVHHGNGTQDAFYERPDVLFCSSHQWPFYPGSGRAQEIGEGAGQGFTLNMPLPYGVEDEPFLGLWTRGVIPVLKEYAPEFILVSAGYDAHRADPIGGMQLTSELYGRLSKTLVETAQEVCGGRIVFFLEGGYHLQALAESVAYGVRALLGDLADLDARPGDDDGEGDELFAPTRRALKDYWKVLR